MHYTEEQAKQLRKSRDEVLADLQKLQLKIAAQGQPQGVSEILCVRRFTELAVG
jgi:hypothetical protein